MRLPRPLGYVLAIGIGVIPAFFVVFNAIFSDIFSTAERLFTLLLTAVVYGLLGLIFGIVGPSGLWQWGAWLALPAAIIVVWQSLDEPERALLNLAYLVVAFCAAAALSYAGARLRTRSWRNYRR